MSALLLLFLLLSGPGSGIIISYLSNLLARRGYYLAIDINPHAARTTRESMKRNKVRGDVIQGDLTQAVLERMKGKLVRSKSNIIDTL